MPVRGARLPLPVILLARDAAVRPPSSLLASTDAQEEFRESRLANGASGTAQVVQVVQDVFLQLQFSGCRPDLDFRKICNGFDDDGLGAGDSLGKGFLTLVAVDLNDDSGFDQPFPSGKGAEAANVNVKRLRNRYSGGRLLPEVERCDAYQNQKQKTESPKEARGFISHDDLRRCHVADMATVIPGKLGESHPLLSQPSCPFHS